MRTRTKLLYIILFVIVMVNFIPVDRNNPPIKNDIQTPANVKAILKKACYDCHSNETVWPLYSYIAPASWLVSGDVANGRKHLNFSEWDNAKADKVLEEIWEEIEENKMPLKIYTYLHPNSILTLNDKQIIKEWVKTGIKE